MAFSCQTLPTAWPWAKSPGFSRECLNVVRESPGKSAPLELMGAPAPVTAPDSRRFPAFGNFSSLKIGEPSADSLSKRLNFEPAMVFREAIEFQEPRSKQVSRSQYVGTGIVVKCSGYLD